MTLLYDIGFWLQLSASVVTIAATYAYGNKTLWGPILGVVCQVPWWTIMVYSELWGLFPLNAVLTIIHVRNLIKWKNEKQ